MSDQLKDFPGYTGWVPDATDDNDFLFIPIRDVPWGSAENLRQRFGDYWIQPYDQGQTQSCTANAVAAAYSSEYNRFKAIGDKEAFFPSRGFLYYNARKGRAQDQAVQLLPDSGSAIRLAMRSLQKWGVCKDASWPLRLETIQWYPGPYAYFEAQKFMISMYQYKRLDVKRWTTDRQSIIDKNDVNTMDKDGDIVLNNVRSCITQGHPVVLGFRCFFKFVDGPDGKKYEVLEWKKINDPISKWQLPDIPEDRRHLGPAPDKGGHAVLAVGFKDGDKTKRDGFVLCQNSWGTDDEIEGAPLFWMPYNYITDFTATQDFWMMDFSHFPGPRSNL